MASFEDTAEYIRNKFWDFLETYQDIVGDEESTLFYIKQLESMREEDKTTMYVDMDHLNNFDPDLADLVQVTSSKKGGEGLVWVLFLTCCFNTSPRCLQVMQNAAIRPLSWEQATILKIASVNTLVWMSCHSLRAGTLLSPGSSSEEGPTELCEGAYGRACARWGEQWQRILGQLLQYASDRAYARLKSWQAGQAGLLCWHGDSYQRSPSWAVPSHIQMQWVWWACAECRAAIQVHTASDMLQQYLR